MIAHMLRCAAIIALILIAGCKQPNKANIELRKQIQSLEDEKAALARERDAARAQVEALQDDRGSIPTLPQDRLDKLFTTTSLNIQRLTTGVDIDPNTPGDEGFKVTFSPVDQFGDEFKSSGSVVIELFDLDKPDTRLGKWEYDVATIQKKYISSFVLEAFVIEEKWQTVPTKSKLLVRVTFTEELTGRRFDATRELPVKLASN